jgi:hypothetical protein
MHVYRRRLTLVTLCLSCLPLLALADDTSTESGRTEAAVRAVEAHWTRAFLGGDEAYLGKLLDEDYVSVSLKGVLRSKADIISLAKQLAAQGKQEVPPPSPGMKVALRGDAAIVTDAQQGQLSVDVFHYANGAWHAWYSQHTLVTPAPAAK